MVSSNVIRKGELPKRKIFLSNDSKVIFSIYDGPNIVFFYIKTSECVHTVSNE